VRPSKVVAIALNTVLYPDEAAARRVIAEISAETGLPADDPVRFGGGPLWAAIRESVDALPWVQRADGADGEDAAPKQTERPAAS
jgi:hypothetical protein